MNQCWKADFLQACTFLSTFESLLLDPGSKVVLFVVEDFIIEVLIERIIKCRVRLPPYFLLFASITLMLYLPFSFAHRSSRWAQVALFRFHNKKIYLADQTLSLCLSLLI